MLTVHGNEFWFETDAMRNWFHILPIILLFPYCTKEMLLQMRGVWEKCVTNASLTF